MKRQHYALKYADLNLRWCRHCVMYVRPEQVVIVGSKFMHKVCNRKVRCRPRNSSIKKPYIENVKRL